MSDGRQDEEGRPYSLLKLAQPITAKKIQIGLGRYLASGQIRVAEVYFYHYDTLMEEIMSLYEDDLHMVLRPDVTQATIDLVARTRCNTERLPCVKSAKAPAHIIHRNSGMYFDRCIQRNRRRSTIPKRMRLFRVS